MSLQTSDTNERSPIAVSPLSSMASASVKEFVDSLRDKATDMRRKRILQRLTELQRTLSVFEDSDGGLVAVKSNVQLTLEQEIHSLKKCYNHLASTSCLPSEVLSDIILTFALSQPRTVDGWLGIRRLPWIRITHVCQHWRNVALNCPSLWSDLSFLEPGCMEVMLRRSENAPLRLGAFNDKIAFTKIFAEALSQTHRLQDVDIEVLSSGMLHVLLKVLGGSAPKLQRLFLWCNRGTSRLPNNVKVLEQGADSLKDLGLRQCGFSWNQIPFSTALTYLQLWNPDNDAHSQCRPSKEELVQSLRNMPHLRELDLYNFLPAFRPSNISRTGSPVSLASLERLTVYDLPNELELFFEVIELPGSTNILVGLIGMAFPNEASASSTLAKLQSCVKGEMLHLLTGKGFQELTVSPISGYDDHDFEFAEVNLRFNVGESSPSVTLLFVEEFIALGIFLSVLNKAMDVSQLGALRLVRAKHALDEFFPIYFYLNLPSLQRITFEASSIIAFVTAWCDGYREKEGSDEPQLPPFPALTEIEFSKVNWTLDTVNLLANGLSLRSKYSGLSLIKLRIIGCSSFGPWIYHALQDCGNVEVDWDGFYEDEDTDDYDDNTVEDKDDLGDEGEYEEEEEGDAEEDEDEG